MKKRILAAASALVLLLLLVSAAGADGPSTWDPVNQAYMYNEEHYGVVICTKMNVRNRPATSGSTYGSIRNGQPVKILGTSQDGNFYLLDLASCGIASSEYYGYAKSSLIKMDPEYIIASRLLNLYATPWGDGLKNGEQNNRAFLVISAVPGWYAVQATDSTPGSAFIRAKDIALDNSGRYVVTWDTDLYDDNTMAKSGVVKRFTVGSLIGISGEFSRMVFNEGKDNEFRAWVKSQFVAPVIN